MLEVRIPSIRSEMGFLASQFAFTEGSIFENYDGYEFGSMEALQSRFDGDRELFSVLQMECGNLYGTPCQYHVITYDTNYDRIFGEDADKRCERVFEFMAILQDGFSTDDMVSHEVVYRGMEEFTAYVSKVHFESASQTTLASPNNPHGANSDSWTQNFTPHKLYNGEHSPNGEFDQGEFEDSFDIGGGVPSYIPKEGDVVKFLHSGRYYQVKSVSESDDAVFLQYKHCWAIKFSGVHINEHIDPNSGGVNADVGFGALTNAQGDDVSMFVDEFKLTDLEIPDTFPLSSGKGRISQLYEPSDFEADPNDPFGGF